MSITKGKSERVGKRGGERGRERERERPPLLLKDKESRGCMPAVPRGTRRGIDRYIVPSRSFTFTDMEPGKRKKCKG